MNVLKTKTLEPITREQIKAYAKASGDPNRIHLEDSYAQKFGLPTVVAHGLLTMGLVARVVDDWGFPPKAWSEYEAKFKEKVFPEDQLTIELTEQKEKTLEIAAKNQDQKLILSATVQLK